MFVFITSIRHPLNCQSYSAVEELLKTTLHSVCAQSCDEFKVVVVCNRIPEGDYENRIHFVKVDFPPPSRLKQPNTGMEAIRIDRGTKYAIGIAFAQQFSPKYIMFFDADDLVSNRLVEFVGNRPNYSGWYVEQGYKHQQYTPYVKPLDAFYKHCGTSIIHPMEYLKLNPLITPDTSRAEILEYIDDTTLRVQLGSHRYAPNFYKNQSLRLKPLPFPGAIWVLGTGENHSGRSGDDHGIVIDDNMIKEFSIPIKV